MSSPTPAQTSPTPSPASTPRPLYGGALTLSLPPRFTDVSPYRPLPDHQEVYSDPSTDQSLVVELNAPLGCMDTEAGGEHMVELAGVSDAVRCEVVETRVVGVMEFVSLVPPPAFASLTVADMLVSKYRDDDSKANEVRVWLLLVRMAREQTDLLIILNSPKAWSEHTSIGSGAAQDRRVVSDAESEAIIREAYSSLRVNDYGLFATGAAAGIEGEGVQAGVDERMQV